MVPIKEALTFDDVTLAPKYSEILPSEVNTGVELTKYLKLKIPLLSSAMDTVTESKISEYFGARVTSSKVRASFIGTMIIYIRFLLNLKSLSEIFTYYKTLFRIFSARFRFENLYFLKIFFAFCNYFVKSATHKNF